MKPLLILRPEPGCTASVTAAQALGLEAFGVPLALIEPVPWPEPDLAFDAILVGSANAFRHGGPQLMALRHLCVHAVGQATAEAAAAAGFTVALVGEGGLQAVLDTVTAPCRLLRLSGTERVLLSVPAGIALIEREVYTAKPLPLTSVPSGPTVVALHSGVAARRFSAECDRLGLDCSQFTLACIGPRVAAAAGGGWDAVHAASSPDDRALLALAADLCQNPAQSRLTGP